MTWAGFTVPPAAIESELFPQHHCWKAIKISEISSVNCWSQCRVEKTRKAKNSTLSHKLVKNEKEVVVSLHEKNVNLLLLNCLPVRGKVRCTLCKQQTLFISVPESTHKEAGYLFSYLSVIYLSWMLIIDPSRQILLHSNECTARANDRARAASNWRKFVAAAAAQKHKKVAKEKRAAAEEE